MKALILLTLIISSSTLFAENEEKSLELKTHINKIMMTKDKLFRLELREHAAVYHADEKFEPCLQTGMKENREVVLRVSAFSLMVLECNLTEKEKAKK